MPRKYRFWVVVTLVAAFAAGLLGGIFSERYFFHARRHARMQREPSRAPDLEQMAKDLGLSLDQKERISQIFETNDAKFKELRSEMHKQLSNLRLEIKSQIDAVLTPEQKQKLESIIAQHRDRNKKDPDKKSRNSERERSQEKPKGEQK